MRSVLVLMVLAAVAHADPRILVMTDDERAAALELPLINHHASVTVTAPPEGELPLDRAAAAQRACIQDGCWATVFVDGTQVTVVGADGTVRHAPLPLTASPRVFAAIAISLLDEFSEAPESPRVIDAQLAPARGHDDLPAVIAGVPSPSAPSWARASIEAGTAVTPSTIGAQLEVLFPFVPHVRVGLIAGVNSLFDGIRDISSNTTAYDFAAEVRYSIGDGPHHWEIGAIGGVLSGVIKSEGEFMNQTFYYDDHDTGGWIGARFGYTRKLSSMTVTGAIAPILMFDFRGQGNDKSPGLIASLTFGLPI